MSAAPLNKRHIWDKKVNKRHIWDKKVNKQRMWDKKVRKQAQPSNKPAPHVLSLLIFSLSSS